MSLREKLNESPAAQAGVFVVLALAAAFFLLGGMPGGGDSAEPAPPAAGLSAAPADATAAAPVDPAAAAADPAAAAAAAAAGTTPAPAVTVANVPEGPPLPKAVATAYERGETVVVLVVRGGGIDDRLVNEATDVLRGEPGVAVFTTLIKGIARFTRITGPLGVDRAPALIVIRPKPLNNSAAPATVRYGFRTSASVRQALEDALYRGPELGYEPD
jgi:hypothetical protein